MNRNNILLGHNVCRLARLLLLREVLPGMGAVLAQCTRIQNCQTAGAGKLVNDRVEPPLGNGTSVLLGRFELALKSVRQFEEIFMNFFIVSFYFSVLVLL